MADQLASQLEAASLKYAYTGPKAYPEPHADKISPQ